MNDDLDLLRRELADEAVAWRRRWEAQFCEPPSRATGYANEMKLWALAGQLMDALKIPRRLPG